MSQSKKLMEDELLQDKKLLEGIFSAIQDGVTFLDKNLKILHVNHTMNKCYSKSLPRPASQDCALLQEKADGRGVL